MEVEAFVRRCGVRSRLLLLLSGGASAYLASPAAGLTLGDLASVTRALQLAGASIHELNTVRKHVERLKGGRLAAMCAGRIVAMVMSDVIGDPLEVIGSGPVVPDPSTFEDATSILERHGLAEAHAGVMGHLRRGAAGGPGAPDETPKPGDLRIARVTSQVIANNARVVEAAAAVARGLGWNVEEVRTGVQGSSRDVAAAITTRAGVGAARRAGASARAWIWGGETTVDVGRATGLGGPSQELALEAARLLAADRGTRPVWLWAFSTDGADGPTDAAGAIVGRETWSEIAGCGLDPAAMLSSHDSHTALRSVGALIRTGHTGTNLNHVWVLVDGAERPRAGR
jgi:hydroxypyruvate reductase